MKIATALLIAFMLCFGQSLLHSDPVSAHSGYWRNTGGGLNLRSGPGGNYQVIGSVPSWSVVKAYGHQGNWLKLQVLSTGKIGWAWLWNFHESSYAPPAPAPAQPSLQTCFFNYWGQTFCAPYWIALEFYNAATYYGASYWWLMSVAACESNFDPGAYNPASGVTGIMQFTWYTIQAYGWPGANPWSVHDSAWVAAKMFAQGLGWTHWHCFRLISGG
jgi:hypothetical protein